jgi:hypothetical protein
LKAKLEEELIKPGAGLLASLEVFSKWASEVIKKNKGKTVFHFEGELPFKPPVNPPVVRDPIVIHHVFKNRGKKFYSAVQEFDLDESEKRGYIVGVWEFTAPGRKVKVVRIPKPSP